METDHPAPTDPEAVARFRQAQGAARAAALAGLILAALTLWWIGWTAGKGWTAPPHVAADPKGIAEFAAWVHPLIVAPDGKFTIPLPLAFALVVLGPLLAGIASVRLWRAAKRAPERCGRALALLLGGTAFSVVPGLMMQIQYQTKWSTAGGGGGGGSAGLGPAPMCGGLALFIAAYAGWALLHHGPVLRAGAPPGSEPD
ncbi:MAG: hypothetical protein ACYTGX_17785 [Planctomycetota bacterium]|jgi:hypothetical protein